MLASGLQRKLERRQGGANQRLVRTGANAGHIAAPLAGRPLTERALATDWNRPEEDAAGAMSRIARVVAPGLPHLITRRRNRRQATFFCAEDYQACIDLMRE